MIISNNIHQPFDQIGCLWTACSAVGINRHRVGHHSNHTVIHRWYAVATGYHMASGTGLNIGTKIGKISSHIRKRFYSQRLDDATGIRGSLDMADQVASMYITDKRV